MIVEMFVLSGVNFILPVGVNLALFSLKVTFTLFRCVAYVLLDGASLSQDVPRVQQIVLLIQKG